ncbi:sulfotransferase family protein [Caenimonas aquaedulcis]|uniref:Sulfotransferase n=1 Tax=Caenimonas aquaedulcis TaxID=2793270 RepID=A0A931MGG6_9BURK|nr:sulfotransferase [Caenimonas aquaedulcis]MBG9388186.1 sulfotransferase [Caenimonas aquaedulcis]
MQFPVFIVGSPRSGTSALVDVLLSADYSGYREGMFFSVLHGLDEVVSRHFAAFARGASDKVLISAINEDQFKSELFAVVKKLGDAANASGPWFDKTGNPEMIWAIPIIRTLWPESLFIFAKRRGIENVVSRIKKFPGHDFQYHCRDWAANMSAWRETRKSLRPDTFLEVDQQDMIQRPELIAGQLAALLKVSSPERMIQTLRSNRPQQTDATSAERIMSVDTLGWTQQQLLTFGRYCGPEMEAYGYSYDESYRSKGVQPAAAVDPIPGEM